MTPGQILVARTILLAVLCFAIAAGFTWGISGFLTVVGVFLVLCAIAKTKSLIEKGEG